VLATECQKFTDEVVALMVAVMRGEAIQRRTRQVGSRGKKVVTLDTPTFQDRVRAAEWLADRGWGKAPTVVAGPGGVGPAELVIHWGEPPAA
jgi:hypothetical protein